MAIIDNLVSYYSLGEASGDAVDAHGSTTLTDTNTVTAGTGIVSGCRVFASANLEYFTTSSPPLTAVPYTYSFWLKTASTAAMECVVTRQGANAHASVVGINSSGNPTFTTSDGASSFTTITGSSTLSTGTWYHIVGVSRSSTDRELYLNAASEGTSSVSGIISSPTLFRLGRFSTGYPNGSMDEVGVWSRALTTDEITWLYNSGSARSYADIVAGMGAGVGRQRLVHGGLTRGRLIQ